MSISSDPVLIADSNLSRAWGRALAHMMDKRTAQISPLLVSVSGFDEFGEPEQSATIRAALDKLLDEVNFYPVKISSAMIFPVQLWVRAHGNAALFYERCGRLFNKIKSKKPRQNSKGVYFQRLMFYGQGEGQEGLNQLDWIIKRYHRGGKVLMMCQAAAFDPRRDLTDSRRPNFPCMQHVSFIPDGDKLSLNAFYATQRLIGRAYGNLLGLCHLGNFMAGQMGLSLAQVNMMVGCEKCDIPKHRLRRIYDIVKAELHQ